MAEHRPYKTAVAGSIPARTTKLILKINMIDFNRENFALNNEQTPNQRLEENLKMQRDCEIEIERCEQAEDFRELKKTRDTLEVLKTEEEEIRKQLEG